jgi:flagellar biosynthesis/type III secretory pathway protein FliH
VTANARVVLREDAAGARPLFPPGAAETVRQRITREELAGRAEAERLVSEARTAAAEIVARARAEAAESARVVGEDAAERARAEVVARWLVARSAERERLDRAGEQLTAIAVAMAERLLGAALEVDPSRVAELARGVLAEASAARRAAIDAHPLDAPLLAARLTASGLGLASLEIREDATLARGELRLHTDVGKIDARLQPRFERLAAAVRDALPPP